VITFPIFPLLQFTVPVVQPVAVSVILPPAQTVLADATIVGGVGFPTVIVAGAESWLSQLLSTIHLTV
jgi:hypothetical protein